MFRFFFFLLSSVAACLFFKKKKTSSSSKCQSCLVKSLAVLWSLNVSDHERPCAVLKGYFLHEHLRVHWSLVSVCWKTHWHFTWMEKPSSMDSLSLLFRFQVIIPTVGDQPTQFGITAEKPYTFPLRSQIWFGSDRYKPFDLKWPESKVVKLRGDWKPISGFLYFKCTVCMYKKKINYEKKRFFTPKKWKKLSY